MGLGNLDFLDQVVFLNVSGREDFEAVEDNFSSFLQDENWTVIKQDMVKT